jgi:hypothetical protein
LGQFNQHSIRITIVQEALERQLINSNQENEIKLRHLIAFVQAVTTSNIKNNYDDLLINDPNLAHSLGITKIVERPRKTVWDDKQLDGLCRLLDQVRLIGSNQ